MDRSILIEYVDMQAEIKNLRKRIEANEKELEKLEKNVVVDSVSCGKKGKKPLRTVKIQGMPSREIERKRVLIRKNNEKLEYFEMKLLELANQAEEYIEQISKSELRTMFRFYFIDGMSYAMVANQMNRIYPKRGKKYTDENVRKKIQRFFQNVPQCPEKK